MVFSSLYADEIVVKVPLDIDGIPNNGNVITNSGRDLQIRYVHLKLDMLGCNEERIFRKFMPLPAEGIHKTITIRKTFLTECGSTDTQVTVHLHFSGYDQAYGYRAGGFSGGSSSLKSLIVTNVDAVRGTATKIQ